MARLISAAASALMPRRMRVGRGANGAPQDLGVIFVDRLQLADWLVTTGKANLRTDVRRGNGC